MLLTLVVLFGIVLLAVVLAGIRDPFDLTVLLVAVMALALQYAHAAARGKQGQGQRRPPFADTQLVSTGSSSSSGSSSNSASTTAATAATTATTATTASGIGAVNEGVEDISDIQGGLTVYASCFSALSFPDNGGKLWKNIAPNADKLGCGSGGSTGASGISKDVDFHFLNAPSFSRKDGFALGSNTVTGPYSYQMGINGDMAFTLFALCQFTGPMSATAAAPVTMFKLFANTAGNNGIALIVDDAAAQGNMLAIRPTILLGEKDKIRCTADAAGAALLVDPTHKYLFVVVKNYGQVSVTVVDVNAPTLAALKMADTNLGAIAPIVFSNKDMVINDNKNWNANVLAFGAYNRALADSDVTILGTHYKELLRRFDSAYIALLAQLAKASSLTACPYDTATCAKCTAVTDWTNTSDVFVASKDCRDAIGTFCAANPTHARRSCWNVNYASYNDAQCKAYRCAHGVSADCVDASKLCPKPPEEPAKGAADSGSASTKRGVDELLSEDNVRALGRILNAALQPGSLGPSPGFCASNATTATSGHHHHHHGGDEQKTSKTCPKPPSHHHAPEAAVGGKPASYASGPSSSRSPPPELDDLLRRGVGEEHQHAHTHAPGADNDDETYAKEHQGKRLQRKSFWQWMFGGGGSSE